MNKKGKFLIGISLAVLILGGGYGAYNLINEEEEAEVYNLSNLSGTELTLKTSKVTLDNSQVKINKAYLVDGDIEGFITEERIGTHIDKAERKDYKFILLDVTYKNGEESDIEIPYIFEKNDGSMQFKVEEVFEHTVMDEYNYTFEEYEKLKLVDTTTVLKPNEERRGTVLIATKGNDEDTYSLVINNKELKMSLENKEKSIPLNSLKRTSNRTELYGEQVSLGDLKTGEVLDVKGKFSEIEGLSIEFNKSMYFKEMHKELMFKLLTLGNAQSMNVTDSLLFLTTKITNINANEGGHIGTFYLKDKDKNIISTALNYNTTSENIFEDVKDYNLLEYKGFHETTKPLDKNESVEGNLLFTVPVKLEDGTYYLSYKGIGKESEELEIKITKSIVE